MAREGFEKVEGYALSPEEFAALEQSSEAPTDIESMSIRGADDEIRWQAIARDAYKASTDYFDANIRKQLEKNLNLFFSKHPAGSKYHQESFKFRSKMFRPKTRSMIRRHEAAGALAFFSTVDAVDCRAEDQRDKQAVMGAQFSKALIEYRLENSIPWFQTVIGGYQDGMVAGVVISRQEWLYETKKTKVLTPILDPMTGEQALDPESGEPLHNVEYHEKIVKDKPDIVLIPTENFRFDPACDWRDPVASSPYLIELIPMYVYAVKERMLQDNPKTGEKKWKRYTDTEIQSANQTGNYDSTRSVRENNREDSKDVSHEMSVFDVVWVHRNIVRVEGEDYLYYTLGTELMLSDPVPVEEVFFHGRPYAVGSANIETHKNYPSSNVEMGEDLQGEANDVVNQRLDNIKLILNRRHYARRGTNVDWRSLTRSVPGGVVLMDDLNDVKPEAMVDVTSSSYQEQDRINTDFDELMGTFSNASADARRSLNDTVGGMSMALDDRNTITEYQLRVITETWVERVLRQLHTMEIHYESDPRILSLAAGKHQNVDPETVNKLIAAPMSIRVGVGFGATSPAKKIEKLVTGLEALFKFIPGMAAQIDGEELSKEIFGSLGYRDGSRFFKDNQDTDPMVKQLQQQVQQLQQIIQTKQIENQGKLQVEQMRQQGALQRDQLKLDFSASSEQMKQRLDYIKHQITAETNDLRRGELILEEKALEWQIKMQEIDKLNQEHDRIMQDLDRKRGQYPEKDGQIGDGLQDDAGSTVMMNNQYQNVPGARY